MWNVKFEAGGGAESSLQYDESALPSLKVYEQDTAYLNICIHIATGLHSLSLSTCRSCQLMSISCGGSGSGVCMCACAS